MTFFSKNCAIDEIMWKSMVQPKATDENVLRFGKVQEYRHAYNISYVLLFYSNSDYVSAPQCYIKCISPVLFKNVAISLSVSQHHEEI